MMTRLMNVCRPYRAHRDFYNDINRWFYGVECSDQTEDCSPTTWTPLVDICEDTEAFNLYAELPGLAKKDVKLSFKEGVLTICGERDSDAEECKKDYCRKERSYGSFCRSFTLPALVDPDNIQATMQDGLLAITIPKKEEAKPKEIDINVS